MKLIPVTSSSTFNLTKNEFTNVFITLFTVEDPRISILEDRLPDGVRSTLIIREAHDKNFGAYNCSVTNAYGMDAAEIVLRKQSNDALYFISLILTLQSIT